ncbi:MAG TPA: hypothetical protein VN861_03270 [Candidatus Acidoferrales bacterium]|nr:hypothetical protein [Candidatus Acidoferrales bacterium]
MAQDTKYTSKSLILRSKGLVARNVPDQPPDISYFLNMDGAQEREENAISTRWGQTIINRSPDGTSGGTNYFLPAVPVILSRLRSLNGQTYRYAALADGSLWRRAADTQGPYTQIATGLSGQKFTALTQTCFETAQPYLFCYDPLNPIKDSGTGTPSRIGIVPPVVPITAQQYAPQIVLIDSFQSTSGYGVSGSLSTAATVAGTAGTPQLSGNYDQYTDATLSYAAAPDGMIGLSSTLADSALRLKFNTNRANNTYDIVALNNAYSPTDSFVFKQVLFSFPASATTNIGKSVSLNFGNYQSADLIVLVMKVSDPSAVQSISVQFDVNASGYGATYYTKSIIPVSYQGGLSDPLANDPASQMVNEVFQLATGIVNIQQLGQASNLPGNDPNLPIVQPSQMASGGPGDTGAWSVIYMQLGDFLPVGNAGTPGCDWSAVTGWQVQVTTTSAGGTDIAFNGLYIQGSPTANGIGTNAGASSYGGIGYDARYIYWNANTGTPSNPCWEAMFSITPSNPGGSSTLVVLRQAINMQGQYSADPQVTHVRMYIRGGLYGQNWYYADQFPNITGNGTFNYKYILPDSALSQGNILNLQADVPVTSNLQTPINTTLSAPLAPLPAGTNTPTLVTVTVAGTPVFVRNQIVVIGTPQNLEQAFVVAGGTGTFTCYIFLPHAAGEPVQAYSQPAVSCNLAAQGYNQTWLAGDPNNPHFLYYTPVGYPENCPPQNYIPAPGGPGDPISAVINFRGTVFVRTYSTWYQVFPGSPPYMQSTGSKHGSPASFDWSITESAIWFVGWDGIRTFRGSDGDYMSLIIEWLFRDIGLPQTPVPDVNLNLLSNVVSAFKNNTVTFIYTDINGIQRRLRYSTSYKRWRNDSVPATAIFTEIDTNKLLYSIPITAGNQFGWAIVYEDITKDYDDGGWLNGVLVQTPINITLETPYLDLGTPNNQKVWQNPTVDANPNGQTLAVIMLFDDNNGAVAPITLGNITGTVRDKFQFDINDGEGIEAYRASIVITGSVTAAPIIYQADIETAVLPEQRAVLDSYWHKFGTDESKLIKQGYFDYTASLPVDVNLYADGSPIPYYSFTLPANPTRSEVPVRVRFPALKPRLFRCIMTSTSPNPAENDLQVWSAIQIDQKPICIGKGYTRSELSSS